MEMRDAFFGALYERARSDPSIIVLTGDQSAFWLDKFAKDYPNQFLNVGIAEQNMISVAAGLALAGRKVFVHGICNFLTLRAFEQIAVDVCQMKLPVTLVGVGAGYTYSTDGPTHHGVCDLGAMMSLPITILNCSDPQNSSWFAHSVNSDDNPTGPAYIRIEKGELYDLYEQKNRRFNDGVSVVRRAPIDRAQTVIASGYMVHEALKRKNCEVLDIYRFPVNGKLLAQMLSRTEAAEQSVLVMEDNNGGPIASAVAKVICEHGLRIGFGSIAPQDFIFEYGSREFLHSKAGISGEEKHVAVTNAG